MSESRCQKCNSERVIEVYSHASDLHSVSIPHMDYEQDSGYMPYIDNIGGGDDLSFFICLECGQVQGNWPVNDPEFDHDDYYENDKDDEDYETNEEYENRMVQKIKNMPDKETVVNLRLQLYDIEKINDVASSSLLGCFTNKVFNWLNEHRDCWKFDENASEWGTLIFNNAYLAHCFAEEFNLTYTINK